MLTILKRTATVWWQTWPWLVAIYLVAWFLRYWVLQAAIAVGLAHGELWGSLIIALAPIVRLLSYLAMFLVIRSVTPGLQHVQSDGRQRGVADVVLAAILPFLVIYAAWKLAREDYYTYVVTVSFTTVFQGTPEAAHAVATQQVGSDILVVIAVAFAARQVITRFRDRLPRWTMALAVYFDVLWIFLTMQAAAATLVGTPKWIADRRIMVWFSDAREELFSRFAVLGQYWDSISTVLGLLIPVAGLSLAWLTIAGVVYGTPLPQTWAGARRLMLGHRGDLVAAHALERSTAAIRPRWQRVPGELRTRTREFLQGQLARFAPIFDAARLMLHVGPVPIAFFIAAYTALIVLAPQGAYFDIKVSDGYLFRGIALLLGPHEWSWWESYADAIRVGIGAIVEPIRISLVAATYWYCVDQVRAEEAKRRETASASAGVESDDGGRA